MVLFSGKVAADTFSQKPADGIYMDFAIIGNHSKYGGKLRSAPSFS
jgi:hypothetical protein